jgi:TP901 family phage tail tape measure protein
MLPFDFLTPFMPIILGLMGVVMVVLRAGASRIMFDIVGTFQANRLIRDGQAAMTALDSLMLDGLSGIEEAAGAIGQQFNAMVDATVPLAANIERTRLEFSKFVSEHNTDALIQEIESIGTAYGFTAEQSLEAGARMAQLSGLLGESAVPAATEAAIAFGLIGEMTPEDAIRKLINLQQQTNFVFKNTTKSVYQQMDAQTRAEVVTREMANTLNLLNSIEDNSAATMNNIIAVMNEFASQAHLTGESMEYMAAMSATLIEAGEQQGKGGRALRMIYARLGSNINGAADALHELGVETVNSDGSLRTFSDTMNELIPKYQRMNSAQKQQLAQQVAGNRHYIRFIKLAENWDRVTQLQREGMNRTSKVMEESGDSVGYLTDLLESQTVALSEAEAQLELSSAAIGDVFIPSTIKATKFQSDFNFAIVDMLTHFGAVGGALGNIVGAQQILSQTFAPFFSAMLNVKALSLALQVNHQILRAVTGQQLTVDMNRANSNNHYLMSLSKEALIKQTLLGMDKTKALLHESENIAQKGILFDKIKGLKVEKKALHNLLFTKKITNSEDMEAISLQVENNELAKLHLSLKKAELMIARAIDKGHKSVTKHKATHLNLLGQINNFELEIEGQTIKRIINLEKIIGLSREELQILKLTSQMMENLVFSSEGLVTGFKEITVASKMANHSITGMNSGMMGLTMGAMLGDMVLMTLGETIYKLIPGLNGTEASAAAARASAIAMTLSMIGMMASMLGTTAAMAGLSGATATGVATSGADTIAKTAQAGAIGTVGKAAIGTTAALRALAKTTVIGAIAIIGFSLIIERLLNHFNVWNDSDLMTDFNNDILNIADNVNNMDVQWDNLIPEDLINSLDAGTDSMAKFNSGREEMFMGFKAGAVTGDLVKQVQQGGVENFVANTEIIMNNNFSGLTTDELAREVISQIQRTATGNGIIVN